MPTTTGTESLESIPLRKPLFDVVGYLLALLFQKGAIRMSSGAVAKSLCNTISGESRSMKSTRKSRYSS